LTRTRFEKEEREKPSVAEYRQVMEVGQKPRFPYHRADREAHLQNLTFRRDPVKAMGALAGGVAPELVPHGSTASADSDCRRHGAALLYGYFLVDLFFAAFDTGRIPESSSVVIARR
jgi:hypothetical protein